MFHHVARNERDSFLAAVLPVRTTDASRHIVLCKYPEREAAPSQPWARDRSSCELPLPFRLPSPGTKATSGSYPNEGLIKAMEKLQ